MSAVQFAKDDDLTPAGASTNRLIAAALDAYLTQPETQHHNCEPFRETRKQLPRGRTAGRSTAMYLQFVQQRRHEL